MPDEAASKPRRITSVEIGRRARSACWAIGAALVLAGGVATFISDNQAGTTALILFGGLLLFIAITRRVPLLIEVGTAKLDTSYEESDAAFEAGRDVDQNEPLTEASTADSELPAEVLREFDGSKKTYRGAVAARAAGISYRQLDYWARTELVTPSRDYRTDPDGGSGSRYSAEDVVTLRLVKELLDTGVTLSEIRRVVEAARGVSLSDMRSLYLIHTADRTFFSETLDAALILSAPATAVVRLRSIVDPVLQVLLQFD